MAPDEIAVSRGFDGLSLNVGDELEEAPPPAPPISSAGVISVDITQKFTEAASTLAPGEIVKDGYFTLFESVGALEIMDPKMDSGCLDANDSLEDDYDVSRPLLPAEVIGIIDQLLCLEMAWHLGYPLSQTLFTNLYIEAMNVPPPASITDADFIRGDKLDRSPMHVVLRAYCLALLRTCWYVCDRIKFEQYYEEEDFVTNTYHRSLMDGISRDEVRDAVQDARAMIHTMRHSWSAEVALALDARLELRLAFLRATELSELRGNPEPLKTPWVQMTAVMGNIRKTHALGTPVPDSFSTKLQRRLASTMPPRPIVVLEFEVAYGHWLRLFEDGMEVNDVLNYTNSQSLLNFVLTFQSKKPQPLVYARALLQSFIFRENILLGSMSIRQLLDDDLALIVLPNSPLLDPANDAAEVALHSPRFALAHQMESFRQRAAAPYLEILRAWSQNRCRTRRSLCHLVRAWEHLQADAEEADQLLQVQLEEKPLQSEAGEDGEPEPDCYHLPLSSWAYLHKLRIMEWIVQLGFELSVYQPAELAGMYWYLGYLARRRAEHVNRCKAFTARDHRDFVRLQEARVKGGGRVNQVKQVAFERSFEFLQIEEVSATATGELAEALSCLYTGLDRLGLVPASITSSAMEAAKDGKAPPSSKKSTKPTPTSSTLGTAAFRYDVRMRPFAAAGLPELPSHEAFVEATTRPILTTAQILERAGWAAQTARREFEMLARLGEGDASGSDEDIEGLGGGGWGAFAGPMGSPAQRRWLLGAKNCLRSSIAVGLAVAGVQKGVEGMMKTAVEDADLGEVRVEVEVPEPEKGYHEWWIVPKVKAIS